MSNTASIYNNQIYEVIFHDTHYSVFHNSFGVEFFTPSLFNAYFYSIDEMRDNKIVTICK